MKTYNMICTDIGEIAPFIERHRLQEHHHVLVQIFSGILDKTYIKEIVRNIKHMIPHATIIGTTTDGEIADDKITNNCTVISYSVFEQTTLRSAVLSCDEFAGSYALGEHVAKNIITERTKAMILFVNNLAVNVKELLAGMKSIAKKDIVIAGGAAGDNGLFERIYVFSDQEVISNGVAAVSLNNEHLQIHTFSRFNWQEIGTAFMITKISDNRIYELDRKPILQVLKHYLGSEFMRQLPRSSVEFPFLLQRNEKKGYFFITKVHKDGSVQVNENVDEGEQVKFTYLNIPLVLENTIDQMKKLAKKPVETIFIYNCMSMRRYLKDFILQDLKMMCKIAPVSGFFTYGEIFTKNGQVEYGTQSMTLLALSESTETTQAYDIDFRYDIPETFGWMLTLSHLIKASSQDIERLNSNIEMSEQRYRSLFEHNTDIVYSTDLNGNFTSVNPAFEKVLGFKKEEILYTNSLKYIHKKDIPRVKMHFFKALLGKVQYYNLEIPTKSGETLLFQMKNIPIIVNGEKVGIYGIGRNITEQKKAEEKIAYLAYYDIDTRLPNRAKFTELVTKFIERRRRKKRKLAVLFIDMDRFKIINDSIGHYAGDEILKQIAERIRNILPSGTYLGRFGGDKFTLLLTKNVEVDNIIKMAQHILQEISKPIVYQNQEFFITASIGVSLYPNNGIDAHSLLKNADTAMNRAKQQGGNRIKFYSTDMNEQALYRIELEGYLRKALEKNEFFLLYQPLVDLKTGTIFGSEALIRWNHPKLGLISPAEFIPLAEETGLIHEIGRWVLLTACKQTKKWQEMGLGPLVISVNVSATQFQQPGFLDDVKMALTESRLEPSYLNLELTESLMLRNLHYSIQLMKELRELGVHVSIDDFGTGYSSLSYLKNLPINALKIDRSFIQNLHENESDIAIVKAIITMGHGLQLKVVAEGVETEQQIRLLKELKCHYAQGYIIYNPMSAEEFERSIFRFNNISF
ncbi:PAS domain S-box-containing protein/diguanylate cyclase (GGDEF)-like protein [Anoxybacillus vitaminiphilus]|uniref:PAS domain S-box-containing protein/diguanylate cyclase (GGDEF)-like protein n=1 Tax=Paranoxybacillus vitaminiphilus TaxID=581036 RepID=A0A327YH85_9BACL|nr:EAL domain-containing protein [Anoxybacillus vitaminiphilus]RAK19536.1 PAS domain S-box-containing protein/diguanylate cyclase (GGDEF)-like protein [Anoxybacillus vitaminiphilus]